MTTKKSKIQRVTILRSTSLFTQPGAAPIRISVFGTIVVVQLPYPGCCPMMPVLLRRYGFTDIEANITETIVHVSRKFRTRAQAASTAKTIGRQYGCPVRNARVQNEGGAQ